MFKTLATSSKARKQKPFKWPKKLPTGTELGEQFKQTLASKEYEEPFLFGASTSEHQCSTKCTADVCSWSRFAQENKLPQPTDENYCVTWWDNYKHYIDYAKNKLGLNALRFSVEWALVQPNGPETASKEVLDHYADIFLYMIENGITPIICLHHYTDPCWFIDNGGFEKKENVNYFARYCLTIYAHLFDALKNNKFAQQKLKTMAQPLFATYNSPEGYAFKGYLQLVGPPANKNKKGLPMVAEVLKNMMEAHVRTYHALHMFYKDQNKQTKKLIQKPRVGFLKNIHQLDTSYNSLSHVVCSPLTRLATAIGDMVQNECFYRFFTKGIFEIDVPCVVRLKHKNKHAIGALDWIGINYYSNRYMFLGSTVNVDKKTKTDNSNYRFYPAGIYRAVVEIAEKLAQPLSIPMIVTENGMATTDNNRKSEFYRSYLYALHCAIKDGYDVHGYLTWTLFDNYEWPNMKDPSSRTYGLCNVDKNNPTQLLLKDGSQSYIDLIKTCNA